MEKETSQNQSEEEKEIEKKIQENEWEEWETVYKENSEEKSPPETASTKPPSPPQTQIVKPKKDRNKCPRCGSEIVFYFEQEDFYWCQSCHEAYQYEEEE